MLKFKKIAPLSAAVRNELRADAKDLKATAKRKGVELDRYSEVREKESAKEHFELGCWLYRFTKLRGLTAEQDLAERVEIVSRLFLAGIRRPGYDFFTVFDFGERQFDSIFEQGDSDDVLAGLRLNLAKDTTGQMATAFDAYKWQKNTDLFTDAESQKG